MKTNFHWMKSLLLAAATIAALVGCTPSLETPDSGIASPTPVVVASPEPSEPTPSPAATTVPEVTATPEPVALPGEQFCPEVPRPAVVISRQPEGSHNVLVRSVTGDVECEVTLEGQPRSAIVSAAGSLFYVVHDDPTQTATIWRFDPDGTSQPLDFTSRSLQPFGPTGFTVSADGNRIAWVHATFDATGNQLRFINNLQVANVDGTALTSLVEGAETIGGYMLPLDFSPDGATLYLAKQPDGLGGAWHAFHGRYDSVARISTSGGEVEPMFDCPTEGLFLCIGDVESASGTIAYTDVEQGVIKVRDAAGNTINTVQPPAQDFYGYPTFSDSGTLAFVSATLSPEGEMAPISEMGHISLLSAPYTGEAQTALSAAGVGPIWQWIGSEHIGYSYIAIGESGTGIASVDGGNLLMQDHASAVLK